MQSKFRYNKNIIELASDEVTRRSERPKRHGKKGFVILTESFVKIGITKTFCYNNKMLSSVNKTFWLLQQHFWLQQQKFYLLFLMLLP